MQNLYLLAPVEPVAPDLSGLKAKTGTRPPKKPEPLLRQFAIARVAPKTIKNKKPPRFEMVL